VSRIRTIKPEWRTDQKLGRAGLAARVLSVSLITAADDEGRGEWREHVMAADVFGYEPDPVACLREALAKLHGWYAIVYEARGETYFQLLTWTKHQRVDRPTKSRLPEPPDFVPAEPAREPTFEVVEGPREEDAKPRETLATDLGPRILDPDQDRGPIAREVSEDRPTQARRLLLRGYQKRYEAACGDMWQSHDAYHRELAAISKWCAQPGDLEARVTCLLDGVFADPWLGGEDNGRHRRWPLGAVAKDPAKYHAAGRTLRDRAAKAARKQATEEARAREEREKDAATKSEALSPEELRANREALSAALKGIGKAVPGAVKRGVG
jgi:hypothetical protein